MTDNQRKLAVEAMAKAIEDVPNLWLHEVSEDEWNVCYWGEKIRGEKRKWIVVREAASEDEAAKKRDEEIKRMRAEAALSALDALGGYAPEGFTLVENEWLKDLHEVTMDLKRDAAALWEQGEG